MPWLIGSGSQSEDAINTVRSTCLAAGFLVSHVEQLALSFTWPGRGAYCDALRAIRMLLDEIHQNIIIGQRYQDIQDADDRLDIANRRLQEFSRYIDSLGLDRG